MVYFIQGEKTRLIKIGMVASGVHSDAALLRRFNAIQACSPDRLTCLAVSDTLESDRVFHRMFSGSRVYFEWFEPTAELFLFIAAIPHSKYTRLQLWTRAVEMIFNRAGRPTRGYDRRSRIDKQRRQGQMHILVPMPR